MQYTFFYRTESPFSQWHPSRFVVEGNSFNCAEQYMMFQKAVLFGDHETGEKILLASTPREQKELGRLVKNFDRHIWNANCKQIVYKGNYVKFTQNQPLLEKLLATKGTILVEASPTDTIWGVGLAEEDERIHDSRNWRGTNWLGEILTQLQDHLSS